jgi:hypothetical protein
MSQLDEMDVEEDERFKKTRVDNVLLCSRTHGPCFLSFPSPSLRG